MKHTKKEEKEQTLDNISGKEQNLEELYEQLEKSKKGGMSFFKTNSEYYQTVSRRLRNVLESMAIRLTDSTEDIQGTLDLVKDSYENLINACNQYLSRSAKTHHGQARQGIVHNILERAELDMQAFRGYIGEHFLLPENEKAETVGDAIKTIRRKKLFLTKSDNQYEHVGGAASRLTVLKQGDFSNSNDSGYFKEQEEYIFGITNEERVAIAMERARAEFPITDEQYEKIKNIIIKLVNHQHDFSNNDNISLRIFEKMPDFQQNRTVFDFCEKMTSIIVNMAVHRNHIEVNKGLLNTSGKKGERFKLSERNVATFRVAKILGLEKIIAKSETVEVFEPGKNKGRIGNLMQKAEGRIGVDARDSIRDELIAGGHKSGMGTGAEVIKSKITGNFQRELTNLQILDYLTGQVDRHAGNFTIQEKQNGDVTELTGVTGIDNDFAFGNVKLKDDNTFGSHGVSPVNASGELIIPHMDKNLADKIMSLDKDKLKFILIDLIEKENIDAACKRLEILQKAIHHAQKEKSEIFLKDNEWDDKLGAFWNSDATGDGKNPGAPSYIQKFLSQTSEKDLQEYNSGKQQNNEKLLECKQLLSELETVSYAQQEKTGIERSELLREALLTVALKLYKDRYVLFKDKEIITAYDVDTSVKNAGIKLDGRNLIYRKMIKILNGA